MNSPIVQTEKSPENAHAVCFSGFLILVDLVSEVSCGLGVSGAAENDRLSVS
jgi:hypothetical protein